MEADSNTQSEDLVHLGDKKKTIKKKDYSSEQLVHALSDIEQGKCCMSEAARLYNIPRQTLSNKYFGKSPTICNKPGPEAVLGKPVEEKIEQWILENYKRGFHVHKEGLMYSVKTIVEQFSDKERQKLPFKNNIPGKGWYSSFRRRHPKVMEKYNDFSKPKSHSIEENLDNWFFNTEAIIREDKAESAMFVPSRIFIVDEVIIKLTPETKLILWDKRKNVKEPYLNELSFLFAASATGNIAPPLMVNRLPLFDYVPDNWKFERSDSGSINCEVFYDYMVNTFYPYLSKVENVFPTVLFFGCDFPYLSLPLCDFCKKHDICLICFPRNSKAIQSIDSLIYYELNKEWERLDLDSKNDLVSLVRYILTILRDLIDEGIFQSHIIRRFQMNEIYPFNMQRNPKTSTEEVVDIQNYGRNAAVDYMESKISAEILSQFRHCRFQKISWNGPVDYSGLYEVWLAVVDDAGMNDSSEVVQVEWMTVEDNEESEAQ